MGLYHGLVCRFPDVAGAVMEISSNKVQSSVGLCSSLLDVFEGYWSIRLLGLSVDQQLPGQLPSWCICFPVNSSLLQTDSCIWLVESHLPGQCCLKISKVVVHLGHPVWTQTLQTHSLGTGQGLTDLTWERLSNEWTGLFDSLRQFKLIERQTK